METIKLDVTTYFRTLAEDAVFWGKPEGWYVDDIRNLYDLTPPTCGRLYSFLKAEEDMPSLPHWQA